MSKNNALKRGSSSGSTKMKLFKISNSAELLFKNTGEEKNPRKN